MFTSVRCNRESGFTYKHPHIPDFMQAIILAGGLGQRLRPMTDYIPKPLMPLANIPLLEWQLLYLNRFGIRDVVVCAGYKADMIQRYLEQMGHDTVKVSREDQPLGTAGAIKNAAILIHDEFYVLNGDVISDIDARMIPVNHIAVVPLRTQYGILDIRDDRVVGFNEKAVLSGMWINAGIYHLESSILASLPERGDIERTLFPAWALNGMLGAAKFPDATWYSIDSFKDMAECAPLVKNIIQG